MILCIETATGICSVALCNENGSILLRTAEAGKSHASQLTVLIGELFAEAAISATDIDAVAVSKGPGSCTGLRIGVSVAKGIAYGAGKPLIGINTLSAMCNGYLMRYPVQAGNDILLCPMIDARRMEVYNAIFTAGCKMIRETSAEIINENSFAEELSKSRVIFFGNGAAKCIGTLRHENAVFVPDFDLSASYLQKPSLEAFKKNQFEDIAYFEPYYLKEFIATVPKKLLP